MDEHAALRSSEPAPGAAIMASYGLGRFTVELLTGAFSVVVYKFFETEIGLAAILVTVGFLIHSIWNAITYPLVGYFTGKPTFLSSRLGRRFPWILLGAPLSVLAFLLVFAPPRGAPFVVFGWLVLSSCLYDLFHSIWELNYQSIFPDKFRDFSARDKAAGIGTLVGTFGVVGGNILPSLFIKYGDRGSYLASALVIAGIAIVAVALLVPGVRETKSMIGRYVAQVEAERERPKSGFFAQLAAAFKHRNFLAFILLYFFYQAAVVTMQSSIYYVGDYVLGGKPTTLILGGMLVGALASVPFWLAFSKRTGDHQRSLLICALGLAAFSLPMTFVSDHGGLVACLTVWGVAFGGFWFLLNPAMADVIDEVVVKTGKREDGVFYGFRAFFGRLALAVQALSFWAIHELTGFAADPRSPLALFGIKIHLSLLPAVLLLVGALLYWRLNDLDAGACSRNKARLAELGL